MGFLTPEHIAAKAQHAYRRFLAQWVSGGESEFFPYRLSARFVVNPKDPSGTIRASEVLMEKSKAARGWGYTVHRQQVRMRDFGSNPVPRAITIDTRQDLLRLAAKQAEFAATCKVIDTVRTHLPQLSTWLETHVRSLHRMADSVEGLVQVTQFFLANPWPDCYARQIPVPVDTKFVLRHQGILRQWLDLLLPAAGIDVNETTFARRFGLRDQRKHTAFRLLDTNLRGELHLPFDELSLPLQSIATLPVHDAIVVIVENDLNLLTLPRMPRGLGFCGEGNAVNRLEQLQWLDANQILYWGDIDVDGFAILSRLRNRFPHVESILMDMDTIRHHAGLFIEGTGAAIATPTNLTEREAEAFQYCRAGNRRLEQERVLQPHVDHVLSEWVSARESATRLLAASISRRCD